MNAPAVNLAHTPAVYYALAYWLSAVVLLSANKKRYSKPQDNGQSVGTAAFFAPRKPRIQQVRGLF